MLELAPVLTILAIFLVAILYSSVGHGGASGYLAVMSLLAVVPEIMRPTALILNLFVASIATVHYYREGHFSWRIFLPFAFASIPMAYFGGTIDLPASLYKIILGVALVFAAARLAWNLTGDESSNEPPIWLGLIIGAVVGLLSGLIGVGGGIFLTPVLLLLHWSKTKTAAGVSALFIFVNSFAGLLGNHKQIETLPANVWFWIIAAIVGGFIGSILGAKKFDSLTLRRVLAIVLLFAGIKLILV